MLRDVVRRLPPTRPDVVGQAVYDRFCAEPETLAIAVVDEDGAPLGLVERNSFFLQMAAEFGRALFGKRPISAVMDIDPIVVGADTRLGDFVGRLASGAASDLLRGFIVVDQGRYLGVGTALELLAATNAESERRAAAMERLAHEHQTAHARADEAVEAMERARDVAQAANRAKSEFLATMSHEIRTPLNGVLGVVGALGRTGLDERQAEMVRVIESSAETLQTLLSDILDLARVEAGRLEIADEPFDLQEAACAVAELFQPKAEEKGVAFRLSIAERARRGFRGDGVRLKQILGNLLSNAVKFTAAGHIALRIDAEPAGDAEALTFTVEDTGIGFDEATRRRLFSRFHQADGSITRKYGGSGLGLSISAALAEMMDGTLTAHSTPEVGSVFRLTLTLKPCEAVAERPTPGEAACGGLKILLAEDHPINRKVIELMLHGQDVELVTAENGAIAVEAFETGGFNAILMDMQMPEMDGLEATRRIRSQEIVRGLARTPVVMLSANALPEHIAAGMAAGADAYLTKPVDAASLFETLNALTAASPQVAAA